MATTAEYGLGEHTFPRGWFMIADSNELGEAPLALRFFGREFVAYRGKDSGKVFLVDAYCPHMRVHLAKNTTSYIVRDGNQIEGDSIRCPGHGWRFNPQGQCDDIPYSTHAIPKAACIKTFPVIERAGCIWMWHDAEGGAPDYDLPAFAEWDVPGWARWRIDHLGTLPVHPQEIVDNMTDYAHFVPVHGSLDIEYFANEFEGHIIRQFFRAGHRTLVSEAGTLETDTWYTGPGILQSRMGGQFPALMMICHTPVEDGVVKVWHAVMVKVAEDSVDETGLEIARGYQDTALAAFAQDFELWQNKEPAISVLQVLDDGPFHKERIWYRQFYNPRTRAGDFHKRVNGMHVTVDRRASAIAAE